MLHQLVVRRGQRRVLLAVLGQINGLLLLFNPHSHGKGLGFHGHPQTLQHLEGVPGAVSDGQNHLVTGDGLSPVRLHSGDFPLLNGQTGDLGAEPDFPAQAFNSAAQILHHRQQHIRTHMGFGVIEDVLPGSGLDKLLQNPVNPGVVHTGVQFPIGKGSGAPFPELDVAGRVQFSPGKKTLHRLVPGLSVLPPFQHQRLPARQAENQGGEHSRRAKAHHHRPFFRRSSRLGWDIIRNRSQAGPFAAALTKNFALVSLHRHIHGIDDFHIRLLPGIHAPAHNGQLADFGVGQPEHPGRLKLQLVGIVLGRQSDIPQSYHLVILPALCPARRPELHAHCKL